LPRTVLQARLIVTVSDAIADLSGETAAEGI
jgi:hypothetical protein